MTLLLCSPANGQGDSGFLRGEARGNLVLTYGQESYGEFFVGKDKIASPELGSPTRTFYNIYGEYGVSDSVDVGMSLTYLDMDTTTAIPGGADLKDLSLFVKARLLSRSTDSGEFTLLAKPGVKLPLSDHESTTLAGFGDEQVDWRGRIIGQFKWHSGAYVATELGYDKRNEVAHDQTYFSTVFGLPVSSELSLAAFYTVIDTHGGGDFGVESLASQEADSTRVGANVFYSLDERHGISVTAWDVLDGRNVGDEFGFSIGFVLSW